MTQERGLLKVSIIKVSILILYSRQRTWTLYILVYIYYTTIHTITLSKIHAANRNVKCQGSTAAIHFITYNNFRKMYSIHGWSAKNQQLTSYLKWRKLILLSQLSTFLFNHLCWYGINQNSEKKFGLKFHLKQLGKTKKLTIVFPHCIPYQIVCGNLNKVYVRILTIIHNHQGCDCLPPPPLGTLIIINIFLIITCLAIDIKRSTNNLI